MSLIYGGGGAKRKADIPQTSAGLGTCARADALDEQHAAGELLICFSRALDITQHLLCNMLTPTPEPKNPVLTYCGHTQLSTAKAACQTLCSLLFVLLHRCFHERAPTVFSPDLNSVRTKSARHLLSLTLASFAQPHTEVTERLLRGCTTFGVFSCNQCIDFGLKKKSFCQIINKKPFTKANRTNRFERGGQGGVDVNGIFSPIVIKPL